MTAADVLVESLIDWGVDTVFGLPGDGINGIMEALRVRQDRWCGCMPMRALPNAGPPKVVACPVFGANGGVPTPLHNFITKLQEDFYASKEEGFPEIGRPQVWTSCQQTSGERHAPQEAWHVEVRQGREGRHREEPQAGDRHRALGGPKKGSQGSPKESRIISGVRKRENT